MPVTPPRIARARMSPEERHLRSQLVQLLSGAGLLRATLNPHQKVCGKPGCRCARGEKHSALYVVASEDGKTSTTLRSSHLRAAGAPVGELLPVHPRVARRAVPDLLGQAFPPGAILRRLLNW